jgi:hypothetical protein
MSKNFQAFTELILEKRPETWLSYSLLVGAFVALVSSAIGVSEYTTAPSDCDNDKEHSKYVVQAIILTIAVILFLIAIFMIALNARHAIVNKAASRFGPNTTSSSVSRQA